MNSTAVFRCIDANSSLDEHLKQPQNKDGRVYLKRSAVRIHSSLATLQEVGIPYMAITVRCHSAGSGGLRLPNLS